MTTAKIIENNRKIGINTGPNPDGSQNLVNLHDYNMVKCMFDTLRNDGVVHVVIPEGSIQFVGTGMNAGGPVPVTGYNATSTIAYGLIR